MLFNSEAFVVFFMLTFGLYYLPFLKKGQVGLLVLASFYFYAFHNPVLLLLLMLSILGNAWLSFKVKQGSFNPKVILITGVVINLGVLVGFKYFNLLTQTFFPNLLSAGDSFFSFLVNIPLPIGISFYTFEGISLLVDVYKKDWRAQNSFVAERFSQHLLHTTLFVSFFPHLIAGPILKAREFFPQIQPKRWQDINFYGATKQLILGYFLKMVVADNLKDFTYYMDFPYFENLSATTLLLLIFGYSIQIFADFAGYSLIAIGLAKLLGYNFLQNFDFPYISISFSDFWKRWHISLSTWLRDYLYIPLGGNKKGPYRTYFNLFMVMFLGGLWHGSAWSYAIWGGFHGLALLIERLCRKKRIFILPSFFKGVVVFVVVSGLWLFFRLPNIHHAILYIQKIALNDFYLGFGLREINILIFALPVIIWHLAYLWKDSRSVQNTKALFGDWIYGFLLFMLLVNSGFGGSFIYFQF